MKKICIIALSLAIVISVFAIGVTHAKYVEELLNAWGQVRNPTFYFDSDLLEASDQAVLSGGAEHLQPKEIYEESITFHLYNAESSTRVANVDVSYTLTYYVREDGVWRAYDTTTGQMDGSGGLCEHEFTVTPIDGYDEVMVEAVSSDPYPKVLAAYFQFITLPFTVEFDFDRDMGVIGMIIATNNHAGDFQIQWSEGVLPDNADPGGILTGGSAGPDSVVTELAPFTTYRLYFFVSETVRADLDAILASAEANGTYDETVDALIAEAIQYGWVE